jgi:hypothetical protein
MKYVILLTFFTCFFACKKEKSANPISDADKKRAADVTALIQNHEYRLSKYYSESPIDYIDTDQVVKAETDLWPYVSNWLLDDNYAFASNGDVTINQNAVKIPTNSAPVIMSKYLVVADKDGVRFDFVGHEYQTLKYRLVSFTDTAILFWATWNGKKVFSEYKALN